MKIRRPEFSNFPELDNYVNCYAIILLSVSDIDFFRRMFLQQNLMISKLKICLM